MNSVYQMVRLQGRSIRLSQQEYWIHRIFDENPSMKDVYPGNSFSILDAFVVCDAQLEFFDLGRQPIERRYFTIGEASMPKKGFMIQESCIQCGSCIRHCPSSALCVGNPAISGRTIACIAVCAQRFVLFMRLSKDKRHAYICYDSQSFINM